MENNNFSMPATTVMQVQELFSRVDERSDFDIHNNITDSIEFNPTSITLGLGSTAKLVLDTTNVGDYLPQTLSWVSSDPSIVKVMAGGTILCLAYGEVTIKVQAPYPSTLKAECTVICSADGGSDEDVVVLVTGLTITNPGELIEGDIVTLSLTVEPSNASDQSVSWSSTNSNVASVSDEGVLTAISEGTASITATANDESNITESITVSITAAVVNVTSITLSSEAISVDSNSIGTTQTLTATVLPSDATDQSVSWSSGNVGIASVDSDGVVTFEGTGSTTITATTTDGSYTATCSVAITQAVVSVTGIALDTTSITTNSESIGTTQTLTATIEPDSASDTSVTWTSSDDEVASVVNGVVTFESVGDATITVTTTDGSYTATCSVAITQAVTESLIPSLERAEMSVYSTDQSVTVKRSGSSATVSSSTYTLTSGDESIAIITDEGKVQAVSAGTTTITATLNDGSEVGEVELEVVNPTYKVIGGTDGYDLNPTAGSYGTYYVAVYYLPENSRVDLIEDYPDVADITWSYSGGSINLGSTSSIGSAKVSYMNGSSNLDAFTVTCSWPDHEFPDGGDSVTLTPVVYPIEEYTLSESEVTVTVGETVFVEVTNNDSTSVHAPYYTIARADKTSSDEDIATVEYGTYLADGASITSKGVNITGISEGTCVITITSLDEDGVTATIDVTVTEAIEEV